MTRRTKTVTFLLVGMIFFLAAPSAVLYVQGYRIDFEEKRIVQTGGLAIQAWPRSAQIYIDGKPKKKTDILFGQAFIGNLLPGTYFVRLSKEGYADWTKELEIKEKQVTAAQNIFLFPRNIKFDQALNQIENAWPSPDGKKIAVMKINSGVPIIEIIDAASKNALQTLDIPRLLGAGIEPQDLVWSSDGKKFILKAASGNTFLWGMGNTENRNNSFINLNFVGKNAIDVTFHPSAAEKLLISLKSGEAFSIFEADITAKTLSKSPILPNILAFSASGDSLIWLGQDGYVIQSDLSGTPRNTLNAAPLQINSGAAYRIVSLNAQKIFLQEEKTLYYLNPTTKIFEKISDSSEEILFSPDGRKGAYLNGTELWIIYLELQEDQPRKEIGEKAFLTRLSKKISQLTWLRSNHIAFLNDGEIKIAEVDDRDGLNILNIPNASAEKIFFSAENKKLYTLNGKILYITTQTLTN